MIHVKAWLPLRQSHLSPWTTKFDHLRFIAQSWLPEHSHQLPTLVLNSSLFVQWVAFKFSTLFCSYKQPVNEQLALGM